MNGVRFVLAMVLITLAACSSPEKRPLVRDDDERGFIREEYQM